MRFADAALLLRRMGRLHHHSIDKYTAYDIWLSWKVVGVILEPKGMLHQQHPHYILTTNTAHDISFFLGRCQR